jgi:hypothetical protein
LDSSILEDESLFEMPKNANDIKGSGASLEFSDEKVN